MVKDLKLDWTCTPRVVLDGQIGNRMSTGDYLTILFVDVNKELLEAEIHLLSEAAAATFGAFEVEPQQDLEEDHFQAVILKEQLTSKAFSISSLIFLGSLGLLLHFELVYLDSCENFCAEHEKLITLIFAESIDDQALPKNVDLRLLQSLAF
jgi:diacylglycerol kinase family enzyme